MPVRDEELLIDVDAPEVEAGHDDLEVPEAMPLPPRRVRESCYGR
jgi:hypothetical protein